MKKLLLSAIMLSALTAAPLSGLSARPAHAAQATASSPRQQADTTSTAIDAFSDTTSVAANDTTATSGDDADYNNVDVLDSSQIISQVFRMVPVTAIGGMMFTLCVLFILFVLAPVLIIGIVLYFIFRNRRQRMKLAQMAMEQGRPIPDSLLTDAAPTDVAEYQRGMRQMFVGIGLMIFLGYVAGQVGFGIGALVACIGLGKVIASKTAPRGDAPGDGSSADNSAESTSSTETGSNN